jgi:hypothetical protein
MRHRFENRFGARRCAPDAIIRLDRALSKDEVGMTPRAIAVNGAPAPCAMTAGSFCAFFALRGLVFTPPLYSFCYQCKDARCAGGINGSSVEGVVPGMDLLYLGIVFACFASTWGLLCLLKRL